MKTYFTLLLVAITSFSFGQDPRLFDNDWYLTNFIYNGENLPLPNNDEVSSVSLTFEEALSDIATQVCNVQIIPVAFNGDPSTISIAGIDITPSNCSAPENTIFQNSYFNFFFGGSYTYGITEVENVKTLTIISPIGQVMIYSSQMLSNDTFKITSLIIYPNPVKDHLIIENLNSENIKVKVYNSLGKLCKTENLISGKIELENFPSGIYLLKVITPNGIITKKIIKK